MQRLCVTGYDVVIEVDALERLGELAEAAAPANRYVIISDDTVAPLYGERVQASLGAGRSQLLVVPAGEREKSRDRWAQLTDAMLALGVGRDAAVVALGGGVIGDLSGFVAATYLRGIPVVQVPTTLLAMVDASIGGKTGVNTRSGKNLVGAFHRPAAVLIDPVVLDSLAYEHLSAGFAEVLKHGVIADEAYFSDVSARAPALLARRDPDELGKVVGRSIEIKAAVVDRDEREHGERQVLNFGHTIGHAVELLSGYALLHGRAVAIGMVAESACGELIGVTRKGTAQAVAEALSSAGLPVQLPSSVSADAVIEATARDKKSRDGRVRYALPARVGTMARGEQSWTFDVPSDVVLQALG